jgi:hypothetical protein
MASSLQQLSANVLAGGEKDSEPLDEVALFVKELSPMPPLSPAAALPPLPPSPPPLSLDEALTFSKEETTIVFDWDDTILASHWLQQKGVRASALAETLELDIVEAFVPLTETVYELLTKAIQGPWHLSHVLETERLHRRNRGGVSEEAWRTAQHHQHWRQPPGV